MPMSRRENRCGHVAATLLVLCVSATSVLGSSPPAAEASQVDTVDHPDATPPSAAVEVQPLGDQAARLPTSSPLWPAGETSGGGTVTWTADPAQHVTFRHSTGWWGAASTMIRIHGPRAPHVYAFHLRLPKGVSLVKNRFGEIVARRHGHPVGILGRPWATTSSGHHLTTWFSLHDRVVKQHIRFGQHAHFPITADPWWNPFTWQWHTAFSLTWSEVDKCGTAAVTTMSYLAGPTAATNVLLVHVAGRAALMVPGGAFAYAGLGVYGCIGSYFGSGAL